MPRNDLIQLRGGTASQWTTANPVLAAREPGLETDTGKVKYGNGTDIWDDLPYAGGGGGADEFAIFSGTGSGVTDYAENNLTLVADTSQQDWWSVAGNTLTILESCRLEFWFEMGGEATHDDPVSEPDLYYNAKLDGPFGRGAGMKVGQVMPDGETVNVPDPVILAGAANGGAVEIAADPGSVITVTGAAGCIEDAAGVADFAYRMMVVRTAAAPTFP